MCTHNGKVYSRGMFPWIILRKNGRRFTCGMQVAIGGTQICISIPMSVDNVVHERKQYGLTVRFLYNPSFTCRE